MRKFVAIAFAVVLSVGMLTGCSNSKKAAEATTEVKEETVDYGKGFNENGTLEGVKAADYVTVCDYSALKISKKDVEVSESDVQSQIDSILANYSQVTDRKVKKGDTVNIDYKGTVDGKQFDGGTASAQSLKIGSGTFIDGFEDQLIGKTPGETVEVKVTFPKDYQGKEVAGKDAVFETKINYIEETPKLTDQFVKENLYLRPRFSPGYGDFSIEHQTMIVRMIEASKKIGLTVTDSLMLSPSKSVTAVIGISETKRICTVKGCEACAKTDCEYRRTT